MNYVLPYDIWLSLYLQSLGDWLTPVMKFFTWLGYPQAYIIIIAIIYWSFDRKLGLRLAIFLPVTASLNSILKQALHAPRPYWLDSNIQAIKVTNGFGMPSGHAQASTVWLYAGACLRRGWFWALAIIIVLMVGISRVYLGVHFSSQVLAGWLMGIVVLVIFFRLESKLLTWFLKRKFSTQLILLFSISSLILILGAVFVILLRNWEMPFDWIRNSADDLAGRDETILTSVGLSAVAGNAGGFLGVTLGALFSHRSGGFNERGTGGIRLLRSIAGLLIFIALYGIIQFISPDQTKAVLYSIWRFSGFFALSFSAIFLAPLLFMRMNLVTPSKES